MKKLIIMLFTLATVIQAETIHADVQDVSIQGDEGAYTFSVRLKSTETGCEQYADWWEVLDEKGELLYRRILVHSHPGTQPFTRSGGAVAIKANDLVYIRAHMNKAGYVGAIMRGTVNRGFKILKEIPPFKKELETQEPLPKGCLY